MLTIYCILEKWKEENRLRKIPSCPGKNYIDLCSNDYLGLNTLSVEFLPDFYNKFGRIPFSSSASRLLSQYQSQHSDLEEFLKELYGKSALLFNSGYHANVGCISALSLPSTIFLCDKLIHASVIDGLRMGGAEFKRFPHNNIFKLKEILSKIYTLYQNIIIVVESIYSMDGDIAPLNELVELKKQYPRILLYVDEAHAFGVRGEKGLGVSEELGVIDKIDFIIGTLGKAAASSGAFIVCDENFKSFFINSARSFIFSTALPPVNIAWSRFMIDKLICMKEERSYLKEISLYFKDILEKRFDKKIESGSQILPFIVGSSEKAIKIAEKLQKNNILALPIRRPTVPPGGERIRFSLNSLISKKSLDKVIDLISY